MASEILAVPGKSSPISEKNLMIGVAALTVIFLSGCGYAEIAVPRLNYNSDISTAPRDQLADVRLRLSDDMMQEPYRVELVRTRGEQKGYAARSKLYETEDEKGKIHFTLAKQKEFKWFVGLQGRWEF
ncbi:MAG: hypothetical protein ACK52W_06850 [Alphaproteobacteria bacterium]